MQFRIRFNRRGEVLICTPEGEMIQNAGATFRAELQKWLSENTEVSLVMIDFRRVERVDSAGIGALAAIHADLRRRSLRKSPALLLDAEASTSQLLRLTHVITLFKAFTTPVEAFQYLRPSA